MKITSAQMSLKIHFRHGNPPSQYGVINCEKVYWSRLTKCKHFKHFFTKDINISAFHFTQWKLCCLETLMQLNITVNDITATTFQKQTRVSALLCDPCTFYNFTTDTKVDNIINSLHEEWKSDNIYQQSNDLHLWPVTFDVYAVPPKFHVSP